jgi:hypothetical protein
LKEILVAKAKRMDTAIRQRKETILAVRQKAYDMILHSQMLLIKDTQFCPYKIGDQVWLNATNLKTTHPTHKLRTKRYGPFMVLEAISHVAYQLELPPSWKLHSTFHASYLSPYKETVEHGVNFLQPPPDIIDGEPEWEVEAIVGECVHGQKRKKQYCIKWKGYSDAHNTWEPEHNVHASKLMQQYLSSRPTCIRATSFAL